MKNYGITKLLHGGTSIPVLPDPDDADDRVFGRYLGFPEPRVQMHPDLPEHVFMRTLMHELLHHIHMETGHDIPESVVATFESNIVLSMHQNPVFWTKLVESFQKVQEYTPDQPEQEEDQEKREAGEGQANWEDPLKR